MGHLHPRVVLSNTDMLDSKTYYGSSLRLARPYDCVAWPMIG